MVRQCQRYHCCYIIQLITYNVSKPFICVRCIWYTVFIKGVEFIHNIFMPNFTINGLSWFEFVQTESLSSSFPKAVRVI